MPVDLKNLDFFKGLSQWTADAGTKLAELISSLAQGQNNIEQQTNSNATGTPQTPPPINALNVTAGNGHFQIAINHEGAEFFRGVHYFVEHSASPNFTDAHIVHMGTSRNTNLFLGNAQRYFRAYAQYPGSSPGPVAYHGSSARPLIVSGGGSIGPPPFAPSQGSGTGTQGQGHSGFGPIPYRSRTGVPPVR